MIHTTEISERASGPINGTFTIRTRTLLGHRTNRFFVKLEKNPKMWLLSSRGGKALVAGPKKKNYIFCGFPKTDRKNTD